MQGTCECGKTAKYVLLLIGKDGTPQHNPVTGWPHVASCGTHLTKNVNWMLAVNKVNRRDGMRITVQPA